MAKVVIKFVDINLFFHYFIILFFKIFARGGDRERKLPREMGLYLLEQCVCWP